MNRCQRIFGSLISNIVTVSVSIVYRRLQYFGKYTERNSCVKIELLPAATKLGQGNVFTGVCLSTGGGSASVHARIPPPTGSRPPDQAPPSPGSGRHPLDQADPPGPGRPPWKQTPEYGLRVAGMHPTGMHSCSLKI